MIFDIPESSLLTQGEHSPLMVTLSVGIAILSSIMAFYVSTQASSSVSNVRKQIAIMSGSIALGGGVWSMHFIGMLAFSLCTSVSYSWLYTLISIVPAIGASWVALQFLILRKFRKRQLLMSGCLVGVGIGAMHYIGMASMEMAPLLRYDLSIFLLSIVVAVLFSCLSLWIKFSLEKTTVFIGNNIKINIVAGSAMGMAISGMHYTGMAAARFVLPPGFEESSQTYDITTYLALVVTCITLITSFVVLATTLIFKYKDIVAVATLNEKRLSATINTSIDGIFNVNASGSIIAINHALESILGWTEQELINTSVKTIIPIDITGKTGLSPHQNKQITSNQEVKAIAKSGEEIPVRVSVGLVELEDQHLFVGYLTDLREQYKMQEAVKESELKFRTLVANIPGITYRCIDSGIRPMLFVSDGIKDVTGYPASDFLPPENRRNFADFVVQEDLDNIKHNIDSSNDFLNTEYRIRDRYGEIKWMLGYGRRIKAENGKEGYIDGVIMDITPRKNMEVALIKERNKAQQAAEARATFMANMSHEIRTPMNAIIGFSDVLLEEALPKELQKYVSTIHNSAQSLLYILNDILDSAKMDKGELAIELRSFSVVEVVDSVISTLGLQAHKKGIDLVLNVDPTIPVWVEGAPDRLRQILMNIIGNAVKFTQHGSVRIIVSPTVNDSIKFAIQDDGIGMTEEQVDKVFQPFIQADSSMSRKYGGTGLGTTIAKQLIELMNGEISVNSEINKGSCFTIVLPLPEVKIDDLHPPKGEQVISNQNLSILVADDVKQNLDLLRILLTRASHSVTCVENGEEAVIEVFKQHYDIVLMDVQMPVLDGLSASRKIRDIERQQASKPTPIIALTASVLENDKLAAKQSGMDGFTHKPIISEVLFAEINRVLSKQNDLHKSVDKNLSQANEVKAGSCTINFQRGISLWGDKLTLVREIERFVSSLHINFMQANFSENNTPSQEIKDELHRIKGIAGNLGLDMLYKQISDAELYITENNSFDADFRSLLEQHVSDINIQIGQTQKPESIGRFTQSNPSTTIYMKHLTKLLEKVEQNSLEDDILRAVSQHSPEQYTYETQEIIDYCDDFEFVQASSAIKSLIDKIENINEIQHVNK